MKNRLNSLKTGQIKENLNNMEIGIEPIAPNHSPSGFLNAVSQGYPLRGHVYLGKDSITDFSGNGRQGDGFEPPGGGGPNGPGDDDFSGDSPNPEDGSNPGNGYIFCLFFFFGFLTFVAKFVYTYLAGQLNYYGTMVLEILEKCLGQEQIEQAEQAEEVPSVQEVKPPRLTARLPSLVPLLVAGTGLVAWSYLLSPENLLRCLNLFFNLSAMLGRSFGRLLLYVIPQPLQGVAILLGNGVAQVFSFTRRILIPAIMLSRTLMVLGLKLYVLLKLATFGVELCRLFSVLSPPWFKKGVQQVAEAIEPSNQIEEVASISKSPFLASFLKSITVFLFPFVPFPENKGLKLAGWALLMFLVNRDTVYTTLLIDKLLEYPSVVKILSCVLGRFACIFITINLSKELKEKDSKFIIWLFYGSLYYYKVFGLALRASSNLLPV